MRFLGLCFALVLAAATLLHGQSGYDLFQQGLARERADADPRGAIEVYEQVIKASAADRKLAAQALFRIGECHRALGEAAARQAYQRILSEYADQTDLVAEAQGRLTAMRAPEPVSMTLRKISDGDASSISPDGRYVTNTDWTKGGDLVVQDLTTVTVRWLTDREESSAPYVDHSRISPDGRYVAYLWVEVREREPWEFQARIIPMDGGTPRIVYRSPNYFFVEDWAPDGQSLLLGRTLDDKTWQIATVSVQDGTLRQLKSFNWANIVPKFSPDGRYIAYDAPVGNSPSRDIFVLAVDGSHETAVVKHPASDHVTAWSPDGLRLLFTSTRTGTQSLWSLPVKDGKSAGEPELVRGDANGLRPLRMTRGGTFYYQVSGRSKMEVYRAPLGQDGKVSGPPTIVADQHVNSNWGGTLSPDGKRIAYYSNRPETVLVVRNLVSGEEQVYRPDLDIRRLYFLGPSWSYDGRSLLIVVRENERPGQFLYRVDLATGSVEEAGRNVRAGLKAAPDREAVYYRAGAALIRLDLASAKETVVVRPDPNMPGLRRANLAISPDGKQVAYLQGQGNMTSILVQPLDGGEPRVVFSTARWGSGGRYNTLAWSPDQRYLVFVNGEQEENEIWRVPTSGGEAEQVGISMNARIKFPQVAPDGKSIFFSAVEADTGNEVWAMENFLPEQKASR